MIPRDLLSACPHRQFHTLPGLLDSRAALPNSYPNTLRAMQGGSLYHFYDGLWYDPTKRRTHDLPCARRTRYQLSQPNMVSNWEVIRRQQHCMHHKSLSFSNIHHPRHGYFDIIEEPMTDRAVEIGFLVLAMIVIGATTNFGILSVSSLQNDQNTKSITSLLL